MRSGLKLNADMARLAVVLALDGSCSLLQTNTSTYQFHRSNIIIFHQQYYYMSS
jgi:hypothetical protein